MKLTGKKKKTLQYAAGGAVGLVVLIAWITLPLTQKSAWDTAVPEGNPFQSKSADLSSFDSAVPYESAAPGAPLSGELTVNPAVVGEEMGSSLYSSGLEALSGGEDEIYGSGAEGAVSASKDGGKYSPSASAPPASPGKPKLATVASITSGNSGTQSLGSRHSKFFGSGGEKPEFAPSLPGNIGKLNDNNSKLLASVNNAQDKSAKAANLTDEFGDSRVGAAEAFNKIVAAEGEELTTSMEESAAESGVLMGDTAADLKKSDPNLNKKKISMPEPEPAMDDDNDEMYKQMLIKMLLSATLGPMFGAVGQMMAAQINPNAQIGSYGFGPNTTTYTGKKN